MYEAKSYGNVTLRNKGGGKAHTHTQRILDISTRCHITNVWRLFLGAANEVEKMLLSY